MTNSELAALELQARIMGWEPALTWDSVVNVPAPPLASASAWLAAERGPLNDDGIPIRYAAAFDRFAETFLALDRRNRLGPDDGLDHSEY
jgi:hypothetical protein